MTDNVKTLAELEAELADAYLAQAEARVKVDSLFEKLDRARRAEREVTDRVARLEVFVNVARGESDPGSWDSEEVAEAFMPRDTAPTTGTGTDTPCPATRDGLWCDCAADDPACNYAAAAGLDRDPDEPTFDAFDRYMRSGGTMSGWDMGAR